MSNKINLPGFLLATLLGFSNGALAQDNSALDRMFTEFWNVELPGDIEKGIAGIVQSGVTFEEARRRLEAGPYHVAADTGVVLRSYQGTDGVEYHYHLNVPDNYDSAREYPVRFDLHGGVGGRQNGEPRGNGQTRLDGIDEIVILPYAWSAVPWWNDRQVENLRQILDRVKREYNVNENLVALSGISDGGTGSYYIAMRETTRFASVLPLNGFVMVLANRSINDGHSFLNNLTNKPLYAINGGRDRLYPTVRVTPYVERLQAGGVGIEYHALPEAEHNTRWWPDMRDSFEAFVAAHPRNPHPQALTWETTGAMNNRAHWLIIEDLNPAQMSPLLLTEAGADTNGPMIPRSDDGGRVDVERDGNTIRATTQGVASFRLLLSPEVFDFSRPFTVEANNKVVFQGTLEPSLVTLLKWAAQDNDRKMLYGAELEIRL